eukprot:CAMPEP_0119546002 /NCGR_PEP_ID=MMETSP1352-20130426/589_1 /TAXON_ID=265584 /ORGANISM="Stauroneis constricta, Strain CCMP1120" /LENGTH=668 /DNA_ID=CAMNT_0007590651 /DNA_START=114 /DNA_END=2120 /DNA_ORIENTATION=+
MTTRSLSVAAALAGLMTAANVQAFYLPGVNPHSYSEGDPVKLSVNKMTSSKTLLPIEFYKLPFCQPVEDIERANENLGEFLAGDRIENSPYKLEMKKDKYCEQVCVTNLGPGERRGVTPNKVVRAIRGEYHNNWIVDNLNSASKAEDDTVESTRYWQGFPVGFKSKEDDKAYVNNHVNLEIDYHPVEGQDGQFRVVKFVIEPFSIQHEIDESKADINVDADDDNAKAETAVIKHPIESCDATIPEQQHTSYAMVTQSGRLPQPASGRVLFTYDVIWKENLDIHWASRWDVYLSMDSAVPAKVHWLSILNSLVIVCVLSAMIISVLLRNLRQDLARYNRVATDEEKAEDMEERGWKLVHADVFRPPASPMVLSVACGTGAQLLAMSFWTIIFSAIGFLNPSRRGALLMAELLFFVLMGCVNGYVTARLYKNLKGKAWQRATLTTALAFPTLAFLVFFSLDILAWIEGSTDAVPFGIMLILIIMWFGISIPLVFGGAFFGYKADTIEFPVKTSNIPRQIPDQPWFMGVPFTMMIGGILPFGSCFVELYFIMASVWMEFYYYVFGFLLVVFIILIITCAEITLLFTYFQLCNEDYHWWWRSFCTAGSTAIYVFLYSIVYFKTMEANSFATYVLYFGYMGLASLGLFVMTGCIGFFSSFWFNYTIFGSLKVD